MKPVRPFFPFKAFILVVVFALPICLFLLEISEAAGIKNVQRGSVTFTGSANRMPVTLGQAVDPNKTIVWGGISHGGGRASGTAPNDTRIAFDLESGTTLALERLGSPASTPVVEWQAVEFASGVSVQRGLRSLTTAETAVNVTLPNAVDPAKSFVLVSVAPNFTALNNDERWTIRSRLTTATNLELSRNESGNAVDVYWQVVQMEGASVQRGLTTITNLTATATISSINPANSFLIMNFRAASGLTGFEARYMVRGAITNSTTLTFARSNTNNSDDIAWEVVSMSDGTTVQSGARATAVNTDTTLDQAISAVDLSRAFVYLSVLGGAGANNNQLDEVSWTGALTSSTNLRLQRGGTGTAGTVNWQIVQFPITTPTKLAITSVNNGGNPSAGIGFPVVVQSQDNGGAPQNVQSDTGVSLSLKTGGGTLGGTLTGTIAAGTSQITISGVTYTKAESGVVLTAHRTSGDALTDGDSAPFTVDPGAATTLAFTAQPVNTNAGSAIGGPPTVTVQDNFGNTVTSSTASITIAIGTNPSGGVLSGTTTKNASGGVASFSDLSIDQPGNGYTLAASSTGLTGATSNAFNIIAVNPDLVVTSVSNPPASAIAGATFNVTDTTANNGNGTAGASTTSYRLSLDNVITTSDPLLTGSRSVPSLAASGNSSGTITVTTSSNLTAGTYFLGACADEANVVAESNETNNCLASSTTITVSSAPAITNLSPTSGPIATPVTISGSNFGATQGSSSVKFNGVTATPTTWSATSIVAPVPSGATSGPVIVTVGGSASNSVNFNVTAPVGYVYDSLGRLIAVIDTAGDTAIYNYDAVGNVLSIDRRSSSVTSIIEFTPKSGPIGTTVTLQGTAYSTTPSQNTVTFNGTAATVTSATANSLTVTVPSGATSGLINVTAPAGSAASSVAFNVTGTVGAPTITNFTPGTGTPGTAVTITGTNFDAIPANNNVRFNGTISNVPSSTSTTLNTSVPGQTGSGHISVQTVRGSVTSTADFFVPPSPFVAADVQFTARTAIGSSVTVNITTVNKIALVVFDGTAGQWINVQMSNVTFPDRKSNVNLLRPNGTVLFSNSGVPQTGGSFAVQLPDTGSYSVFVNAAAGATGSMNVSVSPTTPGSNPLSLSCDGSCAITCSASNPSLTFIASGGKPPYTWSTTKGTIAPSASDRSRATLIPPPNAGAGVAGTAYQYYTWYRVGGGLNHFLHHPIGCGDVPIASCAAVTHNGCSTTTFGFAMGPCRNAPNPTAPIIVTSCAPPNNVVPEDNSGDGTANVNYGTCDVGFFCDRRTDAMINAQCRPCSVEMQGVTVTVTDSNGNFVSKTPLVLNQ